MAKKPIPIPVADRPNYPSLSDITERAVERQAAKAIGGYPCGIACPSCSEEIVCVPPAIRPTAYDGVQNLKCPSCGWSGSMPTGAY